MEEKFEGPLEMRPDFFEFVMTRIIPDFAAIFDLKWTMPWYAHELTVGYQGLNFIRGVSIAAFLRKNDKILFFTPFVYRNVRNDPFFNIPPNEKSLLFPLELLYQLTEDEQVRTTTALLGAAWKEAKLLDENDVVELFEEKK